ncbi:MAG: clostripain-related cysteine peptidase [bacterium]
MNINKVNLNTERTVYPTDFGLIDGLDSYNPGKINKEIEDTYINEEKVPEEGQKKKWLVILYSAGDNNLASYLFKDINELESVGSDNSTHILTIADQGKQWNAAFKDAKIFYLKKDSDMNKINSPLVKNLGQVNTADPKFMASAISEIMKRFPADHVAIIIGDHGAGWQGAIEDEGNHKFMSLPEIREALEEIYKKTGKRIDVLAFDACLMAMAEVGYELKNTVKYMVASEETEGGSGYNYNIIFSKAIKDAISNLQQAALFKVNIDPEEFAKIIVESAKEYSNDIQTISAVDLDKVNNLVSKIDEFAKLLISKTNSKEDVQKIKDKITKTQNFSIDSYRDLYHFAKLIYEDNSISEDLRNKAKEVIDAINSYIINEFSNDQYKDAYGVSIELPSYGNIAPEYNNTQFAKDTSWDEMIAKLNKADTKTA